MTPDAFETFCLSLPGATVSVQWGDDHVYKVGGKMFAVAGSDGGWSFKASDSAYDMLVAEGLGSPAPYLARAKWVKFNALDALSAEETRAYLAAAHGIVAGGLTRAVRRELGLA